MRGICYVEEGICDALSERGKMLTTKLENRGTERGKTIEV
jgi:hypothetical protein